MIEKILPLANHDAASTLREEGLISIIIPCLNEELSIAACVLRAKGIVEHVNFNVEVIVVDNGSDDLTRVNSINAGARVITCSNIGYGAAIKHGIENSSGEYIVIGDGDGSYDFGAVPEFIKPLIDGYDLVSGNRFNQSSPKKGAMPWSHHYIGNPVLTKLLNVLYGSNILDVHCGLRSMTRKAYQCIQPESHGFEFCSETLILSILEDMSIKQIPVTLYNTPLNRRSKLRSVRDGFRHLYVIFSFLFGVRKAKKLMRSANMIT